MEVRYFDNSATTRIKEEILTEMFPFLSREYGNPSSLYSIGRKSKRAIEEARKRVASLINCNSEEIYFTSCFLCTRLFCYHFHLILYTLLFSIY